MRAAHRVLLPTRLGPAEDTVAISETETKPSTRTCICTVMELQGSIPEGLASSRASLPSRRKATQDRCTTRALAAGMWSRWSAQSSALPRRSTPLGGQ